MRIEWIEKYMTEAEQLIYQNKLEEGLTLLQNLLFDEPGYGSLHNHLGWAFMYYTADTKTAELHLKMAIRFAPAFAPPYLHLGNLYVRAGRYTEAIGVLTSGAKVPGANRAALLESSGQAYELSRDYAKAIRTYKEALTASLGAESATLMESIKRCRKKRMIMMFNF